MKNRELIWLAFARKVIWILFMIMIGYLLIASVFSTCYTGQLEYLVNSGETEVNLEHTFYVRDHFVVHILVFAVFSVILAVTAGKTGKIFHYKQIGYMALLFSGIIAVYIVLAGQYYPKYDQASVMKIAVAFNQGDYYALEEGEYLFKYPFQIGIIVFYQILSLIFGNSNYVAFQLINVLFIVISYYLLSQICYLLTEGREGLKIDTRVICLLFLPYLFYATFLYGTVVGFCFATLSFYGMLLFERKNKWQYFVMSVISMTLAVILKSNYMIFLIAAIIYSIGNAIRRLRVERNLSYQGVALAIVMLVCCLAGTKGMDRYLTHLNGGENIQGLPMNSWVTMGLQDGKSAPGWYNGYNTTIYEQNEFNYDETTKVAMDDLIKIINKYPIDTSATISFFVKKVVSQWNNPTFQSLWILQDRSGKDDLHWILGERGRYWYTGFVNLLQTWILAGSFLYALLRFRKSTWQEILFPLTFIGGFLFHLFWEAKSIYVMPYFLLLLPLCIWGYREWREFLVQRKLSGRRILVTAVLLILICAASYTDVFCKLFARNDDAGVFNAYTQEMVVQK